MEIKCTNESSYNVLFFIFKSQLKDTFTLPAVDHFKWSLVQGGIIQIPCQTVVEGTALTFSGPGIRQAQTVDLDLRNAR